MNGTGVEVLVITTPWCHHCRAMQPDLEQFFATTGTHRPFPADGITRATASGALIGICWWLEATAFVAIGVGICAWAAATAWRWWR